jgi:hypothetical protein
VRTFFASVLLLALFFGRVVFAEGKIPGVVDSTNIQRSLGDVIPALYEPIRAGKLALVLAPRLDYDWRLDQGFEEYYGAVPALNSKGGLPENFQLPIGLPFGRWSYVSALPSPEQRGLAAFWNAQSYWWMHGSIRRELSARLFSSDGRWVRGYKFEHVVITPDTFEKKGAAQAFKERLEVLKPEPIASSTWLTFRFKGDDEDGVWYYSPATKRTRQISGINRNDRLLGMPVTLSDFTVWGEKAQGVRLKALREIQVYVPFASASPLGLKTSGECLQSIDERTALGVWSRWNIDSKRFSAAAPWSPTRAVWVKRNVIEVEAISSEPFGSFGRQLIYVDTESMLPVLKTSFDRSGNTISTVIAMWGMALSSDLKKSAFLDSMLVIGPSETVTLEATNSESCQHVSIWSDPKRFNPLVRP